MVRSLLVLVVLAVALTPSDPVAAQVRVLTREDGTKLIYNENPAQRTRRLSGKLHSVPVAEWQPLITRHAESQGLPPRLVQAVIQAESGYNARAVSNKGCIGLMQLKPSTARELDVDDPYDPDQNVRGGSTYLRQMLDRFGRVELALAAYNAGPGAVERHKGVPPYAETREYVRRVLHLYNGAEWTPGSSTAVGRRPHVVRRDGKILITTDP